MHGRLEGNFRPLCGDVFWDNTEFRISFTAGTEPSTEFLDGSKTPLVMIQSARGVEASDAGIVIEKIRVQSSLGRWSARAAGGGKAKLSSLVPREGTRPLA